MSASAPQKMKSAASVAADPRHGHDKPAKGKPMNMHSNNTSPSIAPDFLNRLQDELRDAGITANNLADLISFLARTAEKHAYEAGDDEFHFKFHELRMALEGAETLMRKHSEAIDRLSFKIMPSSESSNIERAVQWLLDEVPPGQRLSYKLLQSLCAAFGLSANEAMMAVEEADAHQWAGRSA